MTWESISKKVSGTVEKKKKKEAEIKKRRKGRKGKDRAAKTKWVQQGWENKTHMDVFAVCQQKRGALVEIYFKEVVCSFISHHEPLREDWRTIQTFLPRSFLLLLFLFLWLTLKKKTKKKNLCTLMLRSTEECYLLTENFQLFQISSSWSWH